MPERRSQLLGAAVTALSCVAALPPNPGPPPPLAYRAGFARSSGLPALRPHPLNSDNSHRACATQSPQAAAATPPLSSQAHAWPRACGTLHGCCAAIMPPRVATETSRAVAAQPFASRVAGCERLAAVLRSPTEDLVCLASSPLACLADHQQKLPALRRLCPRSQRLGFAHAVRSR